MDRKLGINTLAVYAGTRKDDTFGAVNTPIYMTSNYRLDPADTGIDWGGINSNLYQRNRNPNQVVLQERLCALTGAEDCCVFASGVAALMSVFTSYLKSGDHAVVSKVCYNATNLQFRYFLPDKYGIQVTFVDITDTEEVRAAIRPNTKLIHIETPGNPTTGIADIPAIASMAHSAGALVSVDATFAGPVALYPLKLGADFEIHSMTKYINGHGDALGGCVLGSYELLHRIKEQALVNYGGILAPHTSWLIARGLATAPLRMVQHSQTAMKVAHFLENCPATRFIWYPGLESHPQHDRARAFIKNGQYSGMIAFDIKGDYETHIRFLKALKIIVYAVSLGDIESLIFYYDKSSDKLPYYPSIYSEGFFRFSVGLEDADDLIEDLRQALEISRALK